MRARCARVAAALLAPAPASAAALDSGVIEASAMVWTASRYEADAAGVNGGAGGGRRTTMREGSDGG
jgi:hypothetical protein